MAILVSFLSAFELRLLFRAEEVTDRAIELFALIIADLDSFKLEGLGRPEFSVPYVT